MLTRPKFSFLHNTRCTDKSLHHGKYYFITNILECSGYSVIAMQAAISRNPATVFPVLLFVVVGVTPVVVGPLEVVGDAVVVAVGVAVVVAAAVDVVGAAVVVAVGVAVEVVGAAVDVVGAAVVVVGAAVVVVAAAVVVAVGVAVVVVAAAVDVVTDVAVGVSVAVADAVGVSVGVGVGVSVVLCADTNIIAISATSANNKTLVLIYLLIFVEHCTSPRFYLWINYKLGTNRSASLARIGQHCSSYVLWIMILTENR